MRAQNNQRKVTGFNKEMEQMLENNASGAFLDALREMWKYIVEKRRLNHTIDGDIPRLGYWSIKEHIVKNQ